MNWKYYIFLCCLWSALFAQDREELLRSGESYLRSGEEAKALIMFQKARAQDTSLAEIDRKIRDLQVKMGMWVSEDAVAQSDWVSVDSVALRSVKPAKYDSLFGLAKSFAQKERYAESMRILAFLNEKAPTNKNYGGFYEELRIRLGVLSRRHLTIAESLWVNKAWDLAIAEIKRASFYAPEDKAMNTRLELVESLKSESYNELVELMNSNLRENNRQGALATCVRGSIEFPQDPLFARVMDSLKVNAQMREETLKEKLAKAQTAKDWERMEQLLKQAAIEMPKDTEVRILQMEQQERQKAKLKFDLWIEEARNALRNKQFVMAQSHIQKALEIQPESLLARKLEQDVNAALKLVKEEEEKLKEIKELTTQVKNGQAQVEKVKELKLTGSPKVDQEVKQVQREIRVAEFKRTPENDRKAHDLFLAGIAKYRNGDYQDAVDLWKKVLTLNPNHEQAPKYIANVQNKLSRVK